MVIDKIRALRLVFAAAACGVCLAQVPSSALAQRTAAAPVASPAEVARTRKIVDAAKAFIATLSDDQKKAVQFAFTDNDQRTKWSNFPSDFFKRAGVRWGELNAGQRAALTDLLGAVLSPQGLKMVQDQMAADDITRDAPVNTSGGRQLPSARPGAPVAHFGSDYFFVAFVGVPSTTSPWMFQYGAHHLALNVTVVGPRIDYSPALTGGEPLHYITKDGKPIYLTGEEATKALAFLNGLTDAQRAKTVISTKLINLVLGPGHDGEMVQPEGLSAADMSAAQKAQFLGVIEARIGMMNPDTLKVKMAEVRSDLSKTYFAWYGPSDQPGVGYFRVTGPRLLIEFAPQVGDLRFAAPTEHAHNIYRDPTNEYGAAWVALK